MDKEANLTRSIMDDNEQGDSQGFTTSTAMEHDPVRVLHLSESFFVADTLEDDESMMIPPTQDMLIPSTPPPAETSNKEENLSNGDEDITISRLDETSIDNMGKSAKSDELQVLEKEDSNMDNSINDMTQDIPELDETQQILPERTYLSKEEEKDSDDDWDLKFTETQETQEILTTAKTKDAKNDLIFTQDTEEITSSAKHKETDDNEHFFTQATQGALSVVELKNEKVEESKYQPEVIEEEKDSSSPKQTDMPKSDPKDCELKKPCAAEVHKEVDDSDEEVEPSQSCLLDYQADTYLTFRDRLTQSSIDPPTAHSTPDNNTNEKTAKTTTTVTLSTESGVLMVPSPISSKPAPCEEVQSSDYMTSDSKSTAETVSYVLDESSAKAPTLEKSNEHPPSITLSSPVRETEPVAAETSEDNKTSAPKVDCDTVDLVSSADDTMIDEDSKVETIPKPESPQTKFESEIVEIEITDLGKDETTKVPVKEDTKLSKQDIETTGTKVEADEATSAEPTEKMESDLPDTVPMVALPSTKAIPRLHRLTKLQKGNKSTPVALLHEKFEKMSEGCIGKFKDATSLEKILHSYGILLDKEYLNGILSLKPSEEIDVKHTYNFRFKDNAVYLTKSLEFSLPGDQKRVETTVSSHSGSSSSVISTTTTSTSTLTLHSGELGDVSASSSAKSTNLSGIQLDSTVPSSQESMHKTSTQNSDQPKNFRDMFVQTKDPNTTEAEESKEVKEEISPIKTTKEEQINVGASTSGTSKRGKKASQPKAKAPPPQSKRKRGRAAKVKKIEPTIEVANSTDDEAAETEVKPLQRKAKRRKKDEPEKEPTVSRPVYSSSDLQEFTVSYDETTSDSSSGRIIPGVRVMARWKDSYYYSGIVSGQLHEGKWSVCFDDTGAVIPVLQENLIKMSRLDKDTSVLVKSSDDYFDPGKIHGHFKEGQSFGYEIELESGVIKRYPRTSVILSTEQAKLLSSTQPPTTPATVTINLDNIIEGKRKRKSVQSVEPSAPVKKSPRISRRSVKSDPNIDTTDISDKDSGKQTEVTASEAEGPPSRQRTTKRKAAKKGATKITEVFSDGPVKDPKLFGDYAFLMTNADRKVMPKQVCKISEAENSAAEEEIVPFNKEELEHYIVTRGGVILDGFEDVQKCKRKHIYLLANTFLRTMKYIQSLASGICCIKHHWVRACCHKRQVLDLGSYILPSGKSIITDEIVEWHGKNNVLKGKKICLVSAPESTFVYTWAPVLVSAKADYVQKWTLPPAKGGNKGARRIDVLVTNHLCPEDILKSAKARKIPIVSSEWIIQSLIAGECVPYDAHPKFRHDFTE